MIYELWEESDGYSFFAEDNSAMRSLLTSDAVLIWSVEAGDWDEAHSKKHEFLGWDPYKPMA